MYAELGIRPSALAVAEHYRGLLSGFVIDTIDSGFENSVQRLNIKTLATNTLMKTQDDRRRLAQDVLNLIQTL